MRAITAVKLKDWDLAEKDLKLVLKQNPKNANALNILGYMLSLNKSRLQEALDYLNQALSIAPNNPAFMDSMGWAYYQLGDLQNALAFLNKANELAKDSQIAAHLGEVLWTSNNKKEAMLVWQKALKYNDENEELLQTLKRLNVNLPTP